MFAQLDPTAAGTWAAVALTIFGATAGSYAAVRVCLATLTAEVRAITKRLDEVAAGDTGVLGELKAKVATNTTNIADIYGRLRTLEAVCAGNHAHQPPVSQ